MTFLIRKATLVVDRPEDVQLQGRLNMPAVTYDDLINGRHRVDGQLLIVSQQEPLEKLKEVVARGVSIADARYVALPEGQTLPDLVFGNIDYLRSLFAQSLGVKSDRVRPLSQWERPTSWEPYVFNDETLNEVTRWRPRNLAFFVGDYGSGKSTFAQLMALKLLTGPTLWPTGARISICAWEDDQEDYRDRIYRFACGGDPNEASTLDYAQELERRIFWFEPERDTERLLDEYLDNIEYLTLHENVKVHVADPWNSFSHLDDEERETKYVEKMLNRMQELTRRLDTTIMLVTHLPKIQGLVRGGVKAFSIGDAAGSKQWGNKGDMGYCVTRTRLIGAAVNGMSDEGLKALKLTPSHIMGARAAHPGPISEEHLIVVVDKVKIEGMRPHSRQMGVKTLMAFGYDRETCDLRHEPAASEIARMLWR